MTKDTLWTAMFASTCVMLLSSFVIFDLWQEDISRRSKQIALLSEKLRDALETIEYLEGQDCELALDVCRLQGADIGSRLAECYETQSNLKVCYQSLEKCQYETVELSSECGI